MRRQPTGAAGAVGGGDPVAEWLSLLSAVQARYLGHPPLGQAEHSATSGDNLGVVQSGSAGLLVPPQAYGGAAQYSRW